MAIKFPSIQVVKGDTEHISFSGKRVRRQTILVQVGKLSLSKKALILGVALVLCQILDGLLTYFGLELLGIHNEGNGFLRMLIETYGTAPALFFAKIAAIGLAIALMLDSHKRRWVRPIIALLVIIYMVLAIIPWTFILAKTNHQAVIKE